MTERFDNAMARMKVAEKELNNQYVENIDQALADPKNAKHKEELLELRELEVKFRDEELTAKEDARWKLLGNKHRARLSYNEIREDEVGMKTKVSDGMLLIGRWARSLLQKAVHPFSDSKPKKASVPKHS